jgi:hypothetical protein
MPAWLRLLAPIVIGAALGALVGHFSSCSSGTCPLTATWWRGALYGAVMSFLLSTGIRSSS